MAQNQPIIAVKCTGLKKTYGKGTASVQALRGIDLEVPAGKLVMVVGPSGSGKTTLISVIAGILDQTEGNCIVFDNDLEKMNGRQKTHFRGQTIGFVFQAFNLIPTLTAAENTAIPLLIFGAKWKDAIEQANAILKKVGFDQRMIDSFPQDLSGGQQQRVAIARAMIHNPRLIVCDEPTSALDHETGRTIMEILRNLTLQQNRALIVVTHDARIFEFADKIARMDDGYITGVFNSADEMNNKNKTSGKN
jgi:putative ABC transport system ATP-binding protein